MKDFLEAIIEDFLDLSIKDKLALISVIVAIIFLIVAIIICDFTTPQKYLAIAATLGVSSFVTAIWDK